MTEPTRAAIDPPDTRPSTSPLIELRGVRMQFPSVLALAGIDLEVPSGQVLALVGENGAGKSTLVSILAGLRSGFDGEIFVNGRPSALGSPQQARAAGIALVEQELSLVPELSVAENILLGHPRMGRLPGVFTRRLVEATAREIVDLLGVDLPLRRLVRYLSPAQAQLVEIAKGLARAPKLLILDEPTSSLGSDETAKVMQLIRRLRDRGTAVLYISHKLDEVLEIADHVAVLRDGHKVAEGPRDQWTEGRLIRAMVGRDLSQYYQRTAHAPGEVVLEVDRIGSDKVFSEVSFTLRAGEILGMAGLIGAGRTEVAEALFGLRPLRTGNVRVDGRRARLDSPRAAMRMGLALVPEDRQRDGFISSLSTEHNISLSALGAYCRGPFVAREVERRSVREIAPSVGLLERTLPVPIETLSGGNKQKAIIGKCLLLSPKVLILDEPTRGIDVGSRSEIYSLIDRLTRSGMAVLLISSEMPEVLGLSDRVLVMTKGHVVAEFSRDEATEELLMAAASDGAGIPAGEEAS
jgi:ABC-type sugar transport system ATPase subunit